MASLPAWLPNRQSSPYKHERDEEKDLRTSLKHFDRVLAKSASLGDYVSSIQHAHTCLLLHNRLTDIHLERQREKAERARQRGNSSRVAHHLLKIRQIEAKKLTVPAFVHPDYKQLSERQDVSLAAEGSSALVPTAAPLTISPTRTSPHNHSPHQQQQQQQQHQQQSQRTTEQQSGVNGGSGDNVLYLLQHQVAAISAMHQQQQRPQQPHFDQQQQQSTDTQNIIRRLQQQAATTRQPSAPALANHNPPSDSPNHTRAARPPPPAYQPPTPTMPSSPASMQQTGSPHSTGSRDGRVSVEYERERRGKEENGQYREGEGQTSSGPVVMLQAGVGEAGGDSEREPGMTGYNKNGTGWGNEGRHTSPSAATLNRSPQSGKEEKREEGEGQRETNGGGPIVMLNAR